MSRHTHGGLWCGIGMERPKTAQNLGTLWRSAVCLRADFMFTIGDRYHRQASDTLKAWTQVPYWKFSDIDDFDAHRPHDATLVGIELVPDARPLHTFEHPRQCVYLLGPEDGGLSTRALDLCNAVVAIDSVYCLNVASAGTVVLYDRQAKLGRAARTRTRELVP